MPVAYITLDSQTQTTNYTLTRRDVAEPGIVLMNSGSANSVTAPQHGLVPFNPGESIIIIQMGAGQTSVVAGQNVTIHFNSALSLNLTRQYSMAVLTCVDESVFVLAGDLEAA
jgi:hypothetical protein